MLHAVALMLEDDTLEHIDWVAEMLTKQRGYDMSRSEVIAWLTRRHWRKIMIVNQKNEALLTSKHKV